jgi:predicted Zn-dependent protease
VTEGLEYFESEDFQEILRQYEESVKSGVRIYMDADDLTDIADYYQYQNQPDQAEAAIDLAIEYNPEAIGPMLYKARKALETRNFEEVEQYAQKIEALDMIEAVYLRAEILLSKGKVDEADTLLTQHIQNVSEEEIVDFIKDSIELFFEYGQFAKALDWSACAARDFSDDFQETMADILFKFGKYKDCERFFNELLDKNPYSASYWNALAGVQYMKEDYTSALTSCEYAIAIDPNNTDSLLSKANILFTMGNNEEALSYYKKYSEKRPDDESGYLHLAICLINTGQFNKSIEALQKAVSVSAVNSPALPEIYQEMAYTYNLLGNLDKALWCLTMTEKLNCDHLQMDIIKGHILLTNKKEEEAKELFSKVLRESNNNPNYWLKIIISYQDNEHLDFAYNAFSDFFKTVGEDFNEGYSYMAMCCYDLTKKDEFLYYLKKACDCNPKEAKTVLCEYFPEDMSPKDYYEYASKRTNAND